MYFRINMSEWSYLKGNDGNKEYEIGQKTRELTLRIKQELQPKAMSG